MRRPAWLLVALIALSIQSVTLLVGIEAFPDLKSSPACIAIIGVTALGVCGVVARIVFKWCGCQPSLWAAFFAVTCWSAAIDLLLACSLVNLTKLGSFYMEVGEEYFKSSWGFFALAWDGTAHYALQLFLAHATLLERPCRCAGLFWCGSIINSMPVLLLGAATGRFGADIKPSTALNAPYVLVPIAYLCRTLPSQPHELARSREQGFRGKPQRRSPAMARSEVATWCVLNVVAMTLHSWRAVVALGSPADAAEWWRAHVDGALADAHRASHGFVRVQALVAAFYYAPYHAWAVYQLLQLQRPIGRATAACLTRLATWSVVFAGAAVQAQVTSFGSTAFQWEGFGALVPLSPSALSITVGFVMALLPCAFAWRMVTMPAVTVEAP